MKPEMTKEYHLDGLVVNIPLRYDKSVGRFFEEFPDYEEQPLYTAQGKPIVCAMQDACAHSVMALNDSCVDCGSCRYYEPAQPHELIGLCSNPARRYQPSEVRLE